MLTTRKPELRDLWFKQLMMSDAETMSYNHAYGGTIPFPEEKWPEWYSRWAANNDGKRYYRYLQTDPETFVGEISLRYEEEAGVWYADVVIYAAYRGRGFGSQALELLCSAAKDHGIAVLYDEIAIDNPAIRLFLKHGFSEVRRTGETVLLQRKLKKL